MKKVIFTCLLLILISVAEKSLSQEGWGYCAPNWTIGTNTYSNYSTWSGMDSTFLDTLFNQGQIFHFSIGFYPTDTSLTPEDNDCDCFEWNLIFTLMHNSDTVSDYVQDTGVYRAFVLEDYGDFCYGAKMYLLYLHIGYHPATSISEINNQNIFQLYPSISSGLFQIKTKEQLKKIFITDGVRRIVYSSSVPVSEINLSGVADGIYFYAIEDEKERVWRGKIVKN